MSNSCCRWDRLTRERLERDDKVCLLKDSTPWHYCPREQMIQPG